MPLTDLVVRKAMSKDKPYRLADGNGLALLVHPNGSKYWQFRYRFLGKGKLLALGVYPEVPLSEARDRCYAARKILANGVDPSLARKVTKAAKLESASNSFEAVALEWFAKQKPTWAENHWTKIERMMERDLFPWLGARPIAEITPLELLSTLRRVEGRGALDTAQRAKQVSGQIFGSDW